MPFVKASDFTPPDDEPIHIHDNAGGRLLTGRYLAGRWYAEDPLSGRLTEIPAPTHWAYILDSELHDDSDDD